MRSHSKSAFAESASHEGSEQPLHCKVPHPFLRKGVDREPTLKLHFATDNAKACTVNFKLVGFWKWVVSLVCTSQPLHSNLKCLALCGVL